MDQLPTVFQDHALAPQFQGRVDDNSMASGVQSGFGIIGFRGKVWSIRYRGEERRLMRNDGDGPRNSIEVVVLAASPYISKIWYASGYVEGSNQPPDCFSSNGVAPDLSAAHKQSPTCAACPKNAWGSRVTPQGKQGKECSDSKRLAVSPSADIPNETYGGPLLLRVPAASLQDMAMYATSMQKRGYPFYAIVTQIAFDPDEAFPKFIFTPIRPLNEAEAAQVLEAQKNIRVDQILAEATELTDASEVAPVEAPVAADPVPASALSPNPQVTQPTTSSVPPSQSQPVSPSPLESQPSTSVSQEPPVGGGFGPMENQPSPASTQPVPDAASVGAPPASNAPSPAPAPTPQPQSQPNVFGEETKAPPTSSAQPQSSPTGAPSDGGAPSAGDGSFEASLDDKLNALLGGGN